MTASRPAIACLGAGRMGRGIAIAFAYAGHAVTMIGVKAERPADQFKKLQIDALDEVRSAPASLARFGLLKNADAEIVTSRISVVPAGGSVDALCRRRHRLRGRD
jgi:3-hydroxybutyryl-CoA dehydrogenase